MGRWLLAGCAALLAAAPGAAQTAATQRGGAAIASAHPLATAAGQQMLERGGNAFDAAVAVAAVLAVVEPYSSGLGGGALWLLHRAADGRDIMVDGRETAPAGVRLELYVDPDGKPVQEATRRGGLAVAIPGAPAAIAHVAQRYGQLPLAASLAPAIRYAREGFPVDPRYARIARLREALLRDGTGTAAIFLDRGRAPRAGHVVRQPQLAATLEAIAREGPAAFYSGRIARTLVASVNAAGGVWRPADLEGYRIVEREPVRFNWRGAKITAAALPSAGGIALAQSLGMLERFETRDAMEPQTAHLVVEALRRAFQDRALHLGDSDFARSLLSTLLDGDYIRRRAATIDPAAATPSGALAAPPARAESGNTTHLSVIDEDGNRVAATFTINLLFGSGIVAGDTGVLLNNEMDDFSLGPDVANAYGLRGGDANAIAPGRRPLSSMTPTFVEDGRGVLILGAPGGSRIVSQVLLAILEYMHSKDVDLQRLVGMPRYHHQFQPDRVEIEPEGFPAAVRESLAAKGHVVHTAKRRWGNMQAVYKSKHTGRAEAAGDPRGADVAWY